MKKALVLGFVAILSMGLSEEKFGTGVSLDTATPIADVVKNPEAFVGKTIRIDGTATAVCAHMGCWMAVSQTDKADSPTVRLKVDDGVIVFPVSAKGKAVSAQGTFERIKAGDAEGKEAASEHATHTAKPAAATARYQLKATGAIVR